MVFIFYTLDTIVFNCPQSIRYGQIVQFKILEFMA